MEFFTNISHEFRTPLTLIINPIQDLIRNQEFNLPPEVKRKHQIIHKNSDRLNRLINELMDFRKVQFHKMTIHAEQVEVVKFVRETFYFFQEEAENRNIKLEFYANVRSLVAWLDLNMLEKIIFNLVSNAFKVTPNNGIVTISIKEKRDFFPLYQPEEQKEGFEISIGDTGAGLTKNEIESIFNRFSQVDRVNNNHYGGTGIGLEVVKNFVELQKGKIGVKSKIGKGSEFTVSFLLGKEHFSTKEISNREMAIPFKRNISNSTDVHEEETDTVAILEKEKKEHTLLIVEDNLDLQIYLKTELEKYYNILLAANGKIGLEIAKKEMPHIIITDVMMPIMGGLELCKNIKSDLTISHIPLLMLTAKALVLDKIQGIDSGADAYLSKPFDMDLLKSTLFQLLSSRQVLFNKISDKKEEDIDKDIASKTTTVDHIFIQQIVEHIRENLDDPNLNVESLAKKVCLSRSQLYRKTKSLAGVSAVEFIRKIRLQEAKKLIKSGNGNISEICFKVGFSSPSYFAKCFKEEFGELPTAVK